MPDDATLDKLNRILKAQDDQSVALASLISAFASFSSQQAAMAEAVQRLADAANKESGGKELAAALRQLSEALVANTEVTERMDERVATLSEALKAAVRRATDQANGAED